MLDWKFDVSLLELRTVKTKCGLDRTDAPGIGLWEDLRSEYI